MDKFTQTLEEQQHVTKLFRTAVKITGYERAKKLFDGEGLNDDIPPADAVERAGLIIDELMDEISAEEDDDTIASIRREELSIHGR